MRQSRSNSVPAPQGKKWYYELVNGDIGERYADKLSYVEYFLTRKFKDELLYIFDAEMNEVWNGT